MSQFGGDQVRALEDALAKPESRARLAQALARELITPRGQRWRPFLAGLISGAFAVFAFVLPSLQDQWNAYRASQAVTRYDEIGRRLMQREQYRAAEEAFSRALELAGGQRVDLLQEQLRAHVAMMNEDQRWPGKVPEELRESDFVYLLELETEPEQKHDRAATLTDYGAFLASRKRVGEAAKTLNEAIQLDPQNVAAYDYLGNLRADEGDIQEAEKEYRHALAIKAEDPGAHFNLAVLLEDQGRLTEAESEFRHYIRLAPDDPDGPKSLKEVLDRTRTH